MLKKLFMIFLPGFLAGMAGVGVYNSTKDVHLAVAAFAAVSAIVITIILSPDIDKD